MQSLFVDRTIECAWCHDGFVFTADEQTFFHEKGFTNTPKRCPECRRQRAEKSGAVKSVGAAKVVRAQAVTRTRCGQCGVDTTVPFVPTLKRPVLCRMCFQGALAETAAMRNGQTGMGRATA